MEVGEYKLSDNEPGEQFRPVAEVKIHPEYNVSNGANDIALIRVVPKIHLDGKYVSAEVAYKFMMDHPKNLK